MASHFDAVIDRKNTASVKWDLLEDLFGSKDLVSMWVADMDFPSPAPVVEAIKARAAHGVYGYTTRPDSVYEAVQEWMQARFGWAVEREWICFSPGVVPGIALLVRALTQQGDGIIIQPPVYHPFAKVIEAAGREVVNNPLVYDGGQYGMDLQDLREKARSGARTLILCSPHNPVGRVWTKDELRALAEVCREEGISVISDEIHADLVYPGMLHTPLASISGELSAHAVTCMAPSKTFNLAGLQTSVLIIPDQQMRERYDKIVHDMFLFGANPFGLVALEAAYRHGADWLDELSTYLKGNLMHLEDFIAREIPSIKVVHPEGTYLVWLDCRGLGLDRDGLSAFMRKDARVALDDGHIFGPGGDGFERINIACPRSLLDEGLRRMATAVQGLLG